MPVDHSLQPLLITEIVTENNKNLLQKKLIDGKVIKIIDSNGNSNFNVEEIVLLIGDKVVRKMETGDIILENKLPYMWF